MLRIIKGVSDVLVNYNRSRITNPRHRVRWGEGAQAVYGKRAEHRYGLPGEENLKSAPKFNSCWI